MLPVNGNFTSNQLTDNHFTISEDTA